MAKVKNLPVYTKGAANIQSRPAQATVYPKAGGGAYTGYIIDGKTYKDPQGKVRIDDGSRVELKDGRTYLYGSNTGGVEDYATSINSYKNGVKTAIDNYTRAGRESSSAIDAGVKELVRLLSRQKEDAQIATDRANKAARESYIKASNPYGPVGQRLEALGLGDSGYAESTYAKLGKAYQDAVSENEGYKAETMQKIDSAIAQAYSDGQVQKAEAWRELERDILGYTTKANEKIADMQKAARDQLIREQDTKAERVQGLLKDEYERALDLIKLGVYDENIARALGITPAQARTIAYNATAKTTKTSSATKSKKTTEAEAEEKKKPTHAEQDEYLAWIYRMVNNLIRDEGITSYYDQSEIFYGLVADALKKGIFTEEFANSILYREGKYAPHGSTLKI